MEAAAAAVQDEQHHELAAQLQFPPGYHFVPTELELLGYLRGKIEGHEQPLAVVNEVAILDWQPGSLVEAYKGYGESKWYFFTVREPSSSNKEEEPNRKVRVPGVKATWKATGSVAPIAAAAGAISKQQGEGGEPAADDVEEEKVIVGTKRVLIYQSSDVEEDGKWSMHEYILKGHAKIGQYALCSIQRKQHSDTVDDAGEGTSSSSRKRTNKASNGDPGKAKRRRTKKPSTQPEGLQLQQLQLQQTTSVEAPPKPKPKPRTRRTATKRNDKASVHDSGEGQQHQEVITAPVSSVKPPLTPPQQAPLQALQQSAPLLPTSPLQGCTSSPTDGMLGASAPIHEEGGTRASSFQQYDDDMLLSGIDLDTFMQSCEPQSFAGDEFIARSLASYEHRYQQDYHNSFGGVHYQHRYPELQNFSGQDNSSWNNHGQLQNYQEIGGAFAAPPGGLQHTDAQYYSSLLAQTDQFMGSVEGDGAASGSDGGMDLADAELFAMDALRDDDPLDCLGTQGGMSNNNPEAFQSQDEPLLWSSRGQQQHSAIEHRCDGPPPCRCV